MEDLSADITESIAQTEEGASERFAHTVDGITKLAEQLAAKSA